MFEVSDEYDFAPSGSSKLASLFENSVFSTDSTSSLTYTAPKQPKTKNVDSNETSKSKTQTSVVLAKVIALWKLENNDYKSLGKHGLAIIGSTDLNLFEVISYKEKNNIILRKKINSSCSFYNQKDCFSSFYDNENQNWLVKFDSIDEQNEFNKEIKSRGATIVDNIEPSPNPKKSTNNPTETVTKPDVLPKEGLTPRPQALPRLSQTLEKDVDEANSDSSGSQKRANILSRMARMGQQILPKDVLKNASTDVSDSELDDSKNVHKTPPRRAKRAVPLEKHVSNEETQPPRIHQTYPDHQVIPTQSSNLNAAPFPQQNVVGPYPQNMVGAFPPNMLSPVLLNQAVPYDGFHQYVVTQNAELKMNLAQLSAKLDTVLSIGNKSDIKSDDNNLKSKIKTLELRSENLLTELEWYEKKYDDLQRKCKMLEQKSVESGDSKAEIENLNERVNILEVKLRQAEEKNINYEKLEANLEKYKSDVQEREETIEIQKLKLKDLEEFYEENKDNKNLQETVDTLNDTVTNLKLKLKDFEEHFLKTEAEKQQRVEERRITLNAFNEKIKQHMNNMYQSVLASFTEDNSYTVSQIKSQVAQNLKGTTFAIIKEFEGVYKTEDEAFRN